MWKPIAPAYTELLLRAARVGVWASELLSEPSWRGTTLVARGTRIFFYQPNFAAFRPPIPPQGIPAEWVMANLVLLVPLMLATPAPSWRARFARLAIALAIALLLQVVDIIVTIKAFYAGTFGGQWSLWETRLYQFLDAFVQSFDTQLFPFTIWAGIHFRQLLGDRLSALSRSPSAPSPGHTRAERRRANRKR